jgi:Ca2+-binding RTX toxin-like protein
MGGDGGDFIFGGKGGDRILAGKGADALTGEAGKDRFVFTTVKEIGKGAAGDTIYDFRRGADKIDLSAIDANTHKSGNQTFKWSQLTKTVVQDDWKPYLLVEGDTNKDGTPDFSLKLVGLAAVSAADFIL